MRVYIGAIITSRRNVAITKQLTLSSARAIELFVDARRLRDSGNMILMYLRERLHHLYSRALTGQ